ncbi:MAG: hypothetical protein IJW19_03600 [Clostridia bacterium]|nr:hypothetical protein [Clostridia bacterium]
MNNEFDNKDFNKNNDESNNAKRLRMLGDSSSEDIHLKSDEGVKGAFWPNLWFKYKWHIIISAAFLFIFSVIIIQFATGTKYDVGVLYAGNEYVVDIQDDFSDAFDDFAGDTNGDGEKNVLVTSTVYMTEEQRKEAANGNKYDELALRNSNNNSYRNFQEQMMAGNIAICLLSPNLYEDYKDAFANAEDILGYRPDDELLYADNAIKFKKTDFAKQYDCFDRLPEDTVLCIMVTHRATPKEEKEAAIDLYTAIVNFEAE